MIASFGARVPGEVPVLRPRGAASRSGRTSTCWWSLYALQFVALEFFFRGFLVHGLAPRLGWVSIFVMVVPYNMLHFGKPMPEAFVAIAGGVVLGTLSLRTRSIWWGASLHIAIALDDGHPRAVARGSAVVEAARGRRRQRRRSAASCCARSALAPVGAAIAGANGVHLRLARHLRLAPARRVGRRCARRDVGHRRRDRVARRARAEPARGDPGYLPELSRRQGRHVYRRGFSPRKQVRVHRRQHDHQRGRVEDAAPPAADRTCTKVCTCGSSAGSGRSSRSSTARG